MHTINNILILGSSGHACVIIDILEKMTNHRIIGLIDPNEKAGSTKYGYQVLGREENLDSIYTHFPNLSFFIAIGDNLLRKNIYEKVVKIIPEANFINVIHPSAQIGRNVSLGKGIAIMAGANINPECKLGHFSIVNTNASLDHESELSDFTSLAPGVTTGGNVKIGTLSAISIGATIRHKISIGENTVIGAGALVVKDIGDNIVAYGIPAQTIRPRKIGESYL